MTNPIDGLKVEIGLGSYPLTPLASVTWTDVTSDVLLREGVDFDRGRGSQDDAPTPGRLSLTLNNDTATGKTKGRWTIGGPNATSGWDLRTPIRVRHSTHGTLWVGYVDAAVGGWENGVRPIVRVAASDRLARFARASLPSMILAEQVADDPALQYPLDNPAGTLNVPDRRGLYGANLVVDSTTFAGVGSLTFGADSLGPDALTVAYFESVGYVGPYLAANLYGDLWTDTVAAECWVKFTDPLYCGVMSFGEPGGEFICVYTTGTGNLVAMLNDTGALVDAGEVEAGRWYHVALYAYESGASVVLALYLDGVLVGYDSRTMSMPASRELWVGRSRYLFTTANAKIGAVALYDHEIDVAKHYAAGVAGETAYERWQRINRLAGLDAADYGSSGSSLDPVPTMGEQPTAGKAYLDATQECADVEDGVSFLDRTGVMRFHKRGKRINAAVGLTLLPTDVDHDLDVTSDTARMVNDVSVTRTGGATQRITNALSVAYYDTQDKALELACETDEQATNRAEWIVYERGAPQPYVESVTVDLVTRAATVDVADALTADVSTRIQVTPMPTAESPDTTLDLFVEGIRDRITHAEWRRMFTTSSAAAKSNVFILDDATYGVLDTGGVLA